jgi:putative transposase
MQTTMLTKSTGHGGRTPLAVLRHHCEARGYWPEQASLKDVAKLLVTRVVVRVRGNIQEGRHPYVNFAGVRYSSRSLYGQFGMIGQDVSLEILGDIRTVRAFSEKGAEVGILVAANPWNRTPHNLEMRQAIQKAQREGRMQQYIRNGDPVLDYLEYLESAARNGRVISPAYVQFRAFLSKFLPPLTADLQPDTWAGATDQRTKTDTPKAGESTKPNLDLSRLARMSINGKPQ